jgi:hypothetical protein
MNFWNILIQNKYNNDGRPGAGRTVLVKRLPAIIPPLTFDEALEITNIHPIAGRIDDNTTLMTRIAFRYHIVLYPMLHFQEKVYSLIQEKYLPGTLVPVSG